MEFKTPRMTKKRMERLTIAEAALDGLQGRRSLTNYALIPEEGPAIPYVDQPCFARLIDRGGDREPYAFMANYQSYAEETDENREWADWLINRSVFAQLFLEKDPIRFMKRGSVVHTHFPPQFIFYGLLAQRYMNESPYFISTWMNFRQHMTDDCAFVFSHWLYMKGGTITRAFNLGGHYLLDSVFGKNALRRFLDRDLSQFPPYTMAQGCTMYCKCTSIWNSAEDFFDPEDKERLNDFIGNREWEEDEYIWDELPHMELKTPCIEIPEKFFSRNRWDQPMAIPPEKNGEFIQALLRENNVEDQAV